MTFLPDCLNLLILFKTKVWTSGSGSRLEGMAVDEKPPPAVLISVRNA